MGALLSTEKKPCPDQSGDLATDYESGAADTKHADPKQQTEMVPEETRANLEKFEPGGYDPFGQLFNGPNHTRLPTPELLRVQALQLQRARDLGCVPEIAGPDDDPAPGFSGAAYLTLARLGHLSPRTLFSQHITQRLVEAAEASEDLPQFLHAVDPSLMCNKTGADWDVHRHGWSTTRWNERIPAFHYVESFVGSTGLKWQWALKEEEKRKKATGTLSAESI